MDILVGSVMKTEEIKNAIFRYIPYTFTYEGKKGLNMVFHCNSDDEIVVVRYVKDALKLLPALGGIFYNVSAA